jgi:hypothetical protein
MYYAYRVLLVVILKMCSIISSHFFCTTLKLSMHPFLVHSFFMLWAVSFYFLGFILKRFIEVSNCSSCFSICDMVMSWQFLPLDILYRSYISLVSSFLPLRSILSVLLLFFFLFSEHRNELYPRVGGAVHEWLAFFGSGVQFFFTFRPQPVIPTVCLSPCSTSDPGARILFFALRFMFKLILIIFLHFPS